VWAPRRTGGAVAADNRTTFASHNIIIILYYIGIAAAVAGQITRVPTHTSTRPRQPRSFYDQSAKKHRLRRTRARHHIIRPIVVRRRIRRRINARHRSAWSTTRFHYRCPRFRRPLQIHYRFVINRSIIVVVVVVVHARRAFYQSREVTTTSLLETCPIN